MSANPTGWELTPEQRRDLLESLSDDYVLGYQLGVTVSWSDAYAAGWRDAELDMAKAWAGVAAEVRARAKVPSADELAVRRHVDHTTPCPAKCKSCSRCIAYEAWFRRGRRDYLGAVREAALAQQSEAS